jgi:hypothetical protein
LPFQGASQQARPIEHSYQEQAVKMNNPGIDLEIWKQLREKWARLDARGDKIRVDFNLLAHPQDEKNILAIDVVQHINDKEIVVETVQHKEGEAYGVLGIDGLTVECLREAVREMMHELHQQTRPRNFDMDLTVTMSPHSPTSGEVQGLLVHPDALVQRSVPVNYRYYYVLNALRERMAEVTGERWRTVRADYHSGDLEFYFEY